VKDIHQQSRIVVGLDIGTTKITTVIGETGPDGVIDIIGEGTVPSEGLKRGVVVNLERTINSIRNSIATAERVSGVRVLDAYVGVAGGHIKALSSHGLAAIRRGQEIARSDVERAIENAKAVPLDPNLEVLHALPGEYVVDGQGEIKNPIGMHGVRLEVDVHIVTGAQGPMANLRRCASEAGLTVNSLALQGFASGLAVLEPAEEDTTTILIDMGGGTTDVAVFKKGNLIFSAVIPLGGDHVTADIAQILKIPTDEAERVKKKYGSAVPELADQDLTLELTKSGMVTSVSPFDLSRIIKPRVAEIFNFVRNEIDASLGPVEMISQNVVLTGGSSLMRGIVELARERFKLPVRVGKPRGIAGLIEVVSSPTHATAVGLVRYGLTQPLSRGATVQAGNQAMGQSSMGARVEQQQPVMVGANNASMNQSNHQSESVHFDSEDLEHDGDVRAASLWDRIKLALKDFF
jgi:cell division protein FtsA